MKAVCEHCTDSGHRERAIDRGLGPFACEACGKLATQLSAHRYVQTHLCAEHVEGQLNATHAEPGDSLRTWGNHESSYFLPIATAGVLCDYRPDEGLVA